jgi:hypothetical protein
VRGLPCPSRSVIVPRFGVWFRLIAGRRVMPRDTRLQFRKSGLRPGVTRAGVRGSAVRRRISSSSSPTSDSEGGGVDGEKPSPSSSRGKMSDAD